MSNNLTIPTVPASSLGANAEKFYKLFIAGKGNKFKSDTSRFRFKRLESGAVLMKKIKTFGGKEYPSECLVTD